MKILLVFCLTFALVDFVCSMKSGCDTETGLKWKTFLSELATIDTQDTFFVNNMFEFLKLLRHQKERLGSNLNHGSYIEYLGCFQDYNHQRMWRGYTKSEEDHMTANSCIQICKDFGFVYAGTQARYCINEFVSEFANKTIF